MGVINNVAHEIRKEGVISWLLRQLDVFITKLTTGLNWNDLRGALRGDDPRRPNPRLTVHSESFWFHIKPSYSPVGNQADAYLPAGFVEHLFLLHRAGDRHLPMIYYANAPAGLRRHAQHPQQRALRRLIRSIA